jgi:hypothetical protein
MYNVKKNSSPSPGRLVDPVVSLPIADTHTDAPLDIELHTFETGTGKMKGIFKI